MGVAQPPRLAQADTIYDAGVVERVAEHGVFGIQQGFEEAAIGVEARGVEDGIFTLKKL